METAFWMETKFNFHALQTTICLEVKEFDVLAGDGIQAYQNAKVGSYSLHFGHFYNMAWTVLCCCSHQAKEIEEGGETKNPLCYSDRVNVALHITFKY